MAFKMKGPSLLKMVAEGVGKVAKKKNSKKTLKQDAGAAFNPNAVTGAKLSKEDIQRRTKQIQGYYNQQKKIIAQEKEKEKRKAEVEKKNKEFVKKHGPYVQGGPIGSGEVLPGALD